MQEAEYVSDLIGYIYDAALDQELWPVVLQQACEFVCGATGTLMAQNTSPGGAEFYFQWGNDPKFLKSYQDTYVKLNPVLIPALLYPKIGDVVSTVDLIPLPEFFASRFYKEWVAPQGFIDSIFATLDKSATSYAFVAITRHKNQGLVDDATRRRMRLLAPHFRRAVCIGNVVRLNKSDAAGLADTLDGLTTAVFLVDIGGRIVHANSAAADMLRDGAVFRTANGKIVVARDAQTQSALHEILLNADRDDSGLGAKGIAMPLSGRDDERYIAHVLPLTSGARRKAALAYSAVAAIFARKAAVELLHPVEALANTFKLTPAEARVLMMIINVGGIPEVAPALGVSEATVKTHLQHIFDKTGTKRQADLIKLAAGYISPLER